MQYDGRHVTHIQAQTMRGHPPALTNGDWDVVTDALPSLDAFNAATVGPRQ